MNSGPGYIALASAIVISLALLILASTVSLSGYFSRFNSLESEFKQKSLALAEACGDTALLKLAIDPAYAGNETVPVGAGRCSILPIPGAADERLTITTQATVGNAVSNIKIIAAAADLSIISWLEVPTVP